MSVSKATGKNCKQCGVALVRRKKEAFWQFEERLFCSRSCSDLGRKTTRVANSEFKARYRQIKVNGRRMLEHRWVMEQVLGRPLLRTEHVHHKNHDRLDNRPENLVVLTPLEHGEEHRWHPITKFCVICGTEFTPAKTKRARAQTCGPQCKGALQSLRHAERRARKAAGDRGEAA